MLPLQKLFAAAACLTVLPLVALGDDAKRPPTCGKNLAECQAKVDSQAETIKDNAAEIAGLEAWVTTLRHQAQLRAQADDSLAQQAGQDAHGAALQAK